MTDFFTKYSLAVPTRDQREKHCPKFWLWNGFTSSVSTVGSILTVRNFESSLVQQLCALYKVEKSCISPYHPAGNGQCEHFNRTLYNLLHALPVSMKMDWALCLPQVLFCYNTTPHQATGESPYFLMFGQEPRLLVDFL